MFLSYLSSVALPKNRFIHVNYFHYHFAFYWSCHATVWMKKKLFRYEIRMKCSETCSISTLSTVYLLLVSFYTSYRTLFFMDFLLSSYCREKRLEQRLEKFKYIPFLLIANKPVRGQFTLTYYE